MSTSTKRYNASKANAAFASSQRPRHDPRPTANGGRGVGVCYNDTEAGRGWESPVKLAVQFPAKAKPRQPHPSELAQVWVDCELKADVELCRIAIGLRQSAQMRLWLVLSEHTRATGYNYLDRNQFATLLDQYGIKYTRHNLNRWLRAGQGVYWRLTTYGRIYLCSYENLSQSLIRQCDNAALPDLYDLIATNLPGMRRAMYLTVKSSNLEQFEAQCFAAWHASKESMPISRYALTRLFNRDVKTMIRWQQLANVTVFHSFVHYTEEFSHDVPHHPEGGYRGGVLEYEVNGRKRWSAEFSNAYHTQPIRQHDKRGVSRRVFAISRNTVESIVPPSTIRQETAAKRRRLGGLSRTGKYLYQDSKRAKGSAKFSEKPRAIWKGVDYRRGQHFEHSPDGRERTRVKSCFNASLTLERRDGLVNGTCVPEPF